MKKLEFEHNDDKFENYCKLWCFGNLKEAFHWTCFGHLKKKKLVNILHWMKIFLKIFFKNLWYFLKRICRLDYSAQKIWEWSLRMVESIYELYFMTLKIKCPNSNKVNLIFVLFLLCIVPWFFNHNFYLSNYNFSFILFWVTYMKTKLLSSKKFHNYVKSCYTLLCPTFDLVDWWNCGEIFIFYCFLLCLKLHILIENIECCCWRLW